MNKSIWIFFLLLSLCFSSFSQEENEVSKPYSPTIGTGVGTIGFYGDLNDREFGTPFTSNPGFNVYIIQPMTDYLSVKFNFLIGKIREEERSLLRNLNFETDIRSGAVLLEYNFDHFLPESRKITPFVTAGAEVVQFNPKSDLEAFGGERYNYWTDGTIRSEAENSLDAPNAVIIQRDYSFETDIREAGFNNSTTYSESTFSVPIGVGVTLHLNDQFNFRFESTAHFTFTDYIDGVTPNSSREFVRGKPGNGKNDHFWFNGFSLSYNFQKVEPADPFEKMDRDDSPIDYLATGNTEDFDNDGVIDLIDLCPNTPRNVDVDTLGCPVDSDGDGIPDYKDDEINSEYPEFANEKGVEVSNDMMYKSYLRYKDSSLSYAETINRDFTGRKKSTKAYRVKIGEYNVGEEPTDMSELLSLSDLSKIDQGDKTIYTAGSYRTLPEADSRASELKQQGFSNAEVIKKSSSGTYKPVRTKPSQDQLSTETSTTNPTASEPTTTTTNSPDAPATTTTPKSDVVVFRVQLGAFKTKPTSANYTEIPNLFVVEAGGYYRYMSGSFNNFKDAAVHKVKMVIEGYKGAFVVAYKNGERVPLKSVGVNPISSDPLIGK